MEGVFLFCQCFDFTKILSRLSVDPLFPHKFITHFPEHYSFHLHDILLQPLFPLLFAEGDGDAVLHHTLRIVSLPSLDLTYRIAHVEQHSWSNVYTREPVHLDQDFEIVGNGVACVQTTVLARPVADL